MKREFEKLKDLLFRSNVTDEASGNCVWNEVDVVLKELQSKFDELDKRVACVKKMSEEINKTISKYTESIDRGEHIKMSVDEHDTLIFCSNDIMTALNFEDNTCIDENWCDLFKQTKKEKVEYDFSEEVYTIGNADNTEFICDVYESDFIALCKLGLIWCEDDKEFPSNGGKANYVVRKDEFISIVKNKEIDLSKVPIKKEVCVRFESSWGSFDCDKDGNVINLDAVDEEDNYLFNIQKVDLEEYKSFLKTKNLELSDSEDVLAVGFWDKNGIYNKADEDWRKEIFNNEKIKLSEKEKVVMEIISKLKEIEVDGETMEYILRSVCLHEQVFDQISKRKEYFSKIKEFF